MAMDTMCCVEICRLVFVWMAEKQGRERIKGIS